MPVAFILLLIGLPLATLLVVALRIRAKERARDAYLKKADAELVAAGAQPMPKGHYRVDGRVVKVEAGINPLFSRKLSVRLAAYSGSVHEFELRDPSAVPPEFAAFRPLLDRWSSAGKMFVECYAAGVRGETGLMDDLKTLAALSQEPIRRAYRGKVFTIREGFERDVPRWHWRADQRARLPRETRRWCVSYWHGDPYLNPGLIELLYRLAGPARKWFVTHAEDLGFAAFAFGPVFRRHGRLVETDHAEAPVGADQYLDGEFFDGLLASEAMPAGFEETRRFHFHDRAIDALPRARFYARRLFDDEASWYSGEVEILSVHDLDVRRVLKELADSLEASILPIERRFRKRLLLQE